MKTANPCPKCKKPMERRSRSLTEKRLKQKYYFSEWDYCKQCLFTQHYEEFKKFNG